MKYFAYCRKSSEGEERQALSISAQIDEIKRALGGTSDVEITEWFEEKMSAKAPGRPVWAAMIKRIEKGEADGIVAWHPDRLARNSVDGGWIIHLLDRRVLKDLKFASYSYEHSPQGMFMLQIMFGQSKYYVDNLSVNVKRGIRKKIEMGWLPNLAPLGYRNDRLTSTIAVDQDRFELLRRAWELLLTGAYSVRQINSILNTEWGFRTPVRKRSGGRPLSLGGTYKMFGSPFYAGVLDWYGSWRAGKHEPMVTIEEFARAQAILKRPIKTKPEKRVFAYTGLLRCACGLAITAEEKLKRSGRRYVYYHCTRRARPRCNEAAVRAEILDEQIAEYLRDIQISEAVEKVLLKSIEQDEGEMRALHGQQRASVLIALAKTRQELKTLTDLRVRELIGDGEYVERRKELQLQELQHQQSLDALAAGRTIMSELAEAIVLFRTYAADWFFNGDLIDKRLIASSLCSNPMLAGGKLSIQAKFPFERTEKPIDCRYLRGGVETIGTLALENKDITTIIEAVRQLRQRADARNVGAPMPDATVQMPLRAPGGRASWRATRQADAAG